MFSISTISYKQLQIRSMQYTVLRAGTSRFARFLSKWCSWGPKNSTDCVTWLKWLLGHHMCFSYQKSLLHKVSIVLLTSDWEILYNTLWFSMGLYLQACITLGLPRLMPTNTKEAHLSYLPCISLCPCLSALYHKQKITEVPCCSDSILRQCQGKVLN